MLPANRVLALAAVKKHLLAWHAKYGKHQPKWLPPAGGAEILDILDSLIRRGEGE